jgi:hypothetical protein
MSHLLVAASVLLGAASVGTAHAADRHLDWAGGGSLDIAVPGRVTITQGPVARIIVSGPQKVVGRVYMSGDRLRYRRTFFGWMGWAEPLGLRVQIQTPRLDRLAVHSGANVQMSGLTGAGLDLSVHSGADVEGLLNVRAMTARVHSGADLRLQGRADRLDLSVHSGAGADLARLVVDHASVSAHSGADAVVNPRLSIRANAHSGGDIRLLQRPADVRVETHSGGDVRIP